MNQANDFELLRNITPKAGFKYTELNQNFSLKNDIKKKTKFLILEFPSDKIISFKKGHGNPLFDITKSKFIKYGS